MDNSEQREEEILLSQEFVKEFLEDIDFLPDEEEEKQEEYESHKFLVYRLKKINKIADEILDNIKQEENKRLSSHT